MRINGLTNLNIYNANPKTGRNAQKSGALEDRQGYLPAWQIDGKYFLQNVNFTGGDSLSLESTVKNLDPSEFPPGIRELALKTLSEGNPENKTLINIHKERYGILNDMETLDEARAAFKEFRGVLSDQEVTYNRGSFIDDVKNDRLEYFDSGEDLALQLLKMYWGRGISLNGLTEYTGGKNIDGVLKTFHIDRVKPVYGHYLRFSNEKYNKDVTDLMVKNRQEAIKTKAEKEEGTYIPRGPLTEEHKRKISEGLIKFYSNNPDKLSELSKSQKRYYAEHPEERERLSRVLNTAWNLREAKSIKKAMSKFMRKKLPDVIVFDKDGATINGIDSSDLKAFWKRNVWAKEQWSKCMKKGWEIVKKQEAEEYSKTGIMLPPDASKMNRGRGTFEFEYYPKSLVSDFKAWHMLNGGNPSDIKNTNTFLNINGNDSLLPETDRFSENRFAQYFKENPNVAANFRTAQRCSLMKLAIDLWSMAEEIDEANPGAIEKRKADFMIEMANYIDNTTLYNDPDIEITNKGLNDIIRKVVFESCQKGYANIALLFENYLEKTYCALKNPSSEDVLMEFFGLEQEDIDEMMPAKTADGGAESNGKEFQFDIYPPSLRREIKAWGLKNGYDISKIGPDSMKVTARMNPARVEDSPEVRDLIYGFTRNASEETQNVIADTYYIALAKTCGELSDALNNKFTKISQHKRELMAQIHDSIAEQISDVTTGRTVQLSTQDLAYKFITLSTCCYATGFSEVANMLLSNAEIAYRNIKTRGAMGAYDKLLAKPGYISD